MKLPDSVWDDSSVVGSCSDAAPLLIRSRGPSPDACIFPSARATAINTNNFLFRVLKEAGKKAGVPASQVLRRTCFTYVAQLNSVKDVQAHLRHTSAKTTLEPYIKSVLESVHVAVESLDHLLKSEPDTVEGGQTIESNVSR